MTCSACGTLNPSGMRFCGMCGQAMREGGVGRERRRVSVVFVDLAAFSNLTRGADPEDLRDLADEVLTVVAGVIEDYDGHVDAFRGDGLIALFGAPHSHPDDPQRAVLAAAASLRAIEQVGSARGMPLRGRAGVNTGMVIAGAIGSGRVREYTVMGSAVNLAARLEAAAEPGNVWVGPETYDAARHRLQFEATKPVHLDGFPNVRRAYRLLSTREARSQDPYAHLAFVGREREQRALRDAREAVVHEGRARQLWLVGEAGSGKSRLLRHVFGPSGSAERDEVVWLHIPTGEGMPWGQLARQLFGLEEGEESLQAQQRLGRELDRLLPEEPRWRRSVLASLELVEQRPWRRLDRRNVDRAMLAWRDLLAALTREQHGPEALILIVEDDPRETGVETFLRLLRDTSAPLLVLRTTRGRDRSIDADALHMEPLDHEASLQILDQLASPELQPAARSLTGQLGGMPAHLIELGNALSLQGTTSVSTSLASVLQARLDRLPAADRQLLAHASLAGERVWGGLLGVLAGGDQEQALDALIREKLLVAEPASSIHGQREYRFNSELLRQAVMEMIPYGERPQLHLRIASWLEEHAPLALSELIADQFELGGAPEAAYAHLMTAADLHMHEGDHGHANALFERLLTLPVEPALHAQAALSWAQMALADRRPDQALERLERASRMIGEGDGEADRRMREAYARLRDEARHLRDRIGAGEAGDAGEAGANGDATGDEGDRRSSDTRTKASTGAGEAPD